MVDTPSSPASAVLGALVTGALRLSDVAACPEDAFLFALERDVFVVLVACLEERHGRVGIDLPFALRALRFCGAAPVGVELGGVLRGRPATRTLGYLPAIARAAPRRPAALAALRELVGAAQHAAALRGCLTQELASAMATREREREAAFARMGVEPVAAE